jgi:adenosylhomocysteine nucleosidase
LLRILATFALPSEFAPWRRLSRFQRIDSNGRSVYSVRKADLEVYSAITGVGARSVSSDLRDLFRKPIDLCIAAGLAGALVDTHPAGSILAAKNVCTDENTEVECDSSLVGIAKDCGARVVDRFLTSRAIVNSAVEKSRLGRIADAVDMESFQVLNEAKAYGVPVIAIRAISDSVQTDMPVDFNSAIDDHGYVSWRPALAAVAKAPGRVPSLVRFAVDSSRASRNLAQFLDSYTGLLAGARTESK